MALFLSMVWLPLISTTPLLLILRTKSPAQSMSHITCWPYFTFVSVKILKITKLYFILSSNSNVESKTLITVFWHYLSSYTRPVPLSINTRPTLSSLSLWILDHYTLANVKLLKRVVSLLGTGFYILLLIMVITMFHIFLVFKSCSCNVLASFNINFVSPLCILFLKFPSLIPIPLALLLFQNWDNRRAGQHSTHAEAKVLFWLSISEI